MCQIKVTRAPFNISRSVTLEVQFEIMLLLSSLLIATTSAQLQLTMNGTADGRAFNEGSFNFPKRDRNRKKVKNEKSENKVNNELKEIASAFGDPHFHIARDGSDKQPDLCFDIGKFEPLDKPEEI